MNDLIKTLSRYAFLNMIIFNTVLSSLIGYIAIYVRGSEELTPILSVGILAINVCYMIMIANVLSTINKTNSLSSVEKK